MHMRKALIIGGGVAGPVAALALKRAGIDSVVFESRTSNDAQGGALALAPNGLAALEIIGAERLVSAHGQPIRTMIMADGRGRPFGEFPALDGLPPSWAMSRADLSRLLQTQAVAEGIDFEFDKRLVGVDGDSTGITATFSDGSTARGDLLIGADGIHSAVRALIDPNAPAPTQVPLLNFGAIADMAVEARPDAMYFVFGEKGFFGYWLQPDGRTAWFSNLPSSKPMTAARARRESAQHWLRTLRDMYANDVPAASLIEHTLPEELVSLGSMEIMPDLPHWYRGRMVLIGDSAHAPSSSSGQGASLAIESAVELARCLRDIPDIDKAFATYERLRRGRVRAVASRAAKTNHSKALGPVAKTVLRWLMPVAMRTFMSAEKTLGAEQRFRIDWNQVVS
jgi:2-polyprenyl-6-methoxyphenol hydroxylase-like FAD-dependent oxidoreductase